MMLTCLGALLSPLLGLGLLLWLAHLEDTLPRDVASARRQPAPAPILAIPVTVDQSTSVVTVPGQRVAPVEPSPAPTAVGA